MAVAILTLVWCLLRLPETKGLTYEELDILFEKWTPAWRFKSMEIDLIRDTDNIKGTGGEKEILREEVEVAE
jgi:SP family general alpha glucoside:H+ symporter-like MFS transporter